MLNQGGLKAHAADVAAEVKEALHDKTLYNMERLVRLLKRRALTNSKERKMQSISEDAGQAPSAP
jgi:hypothetical protein